MGEYVLAVGLAIIIMLFFSMFVMKNIMKRINQNAKKYFIDKLQEYDYLIDEKKQTIEELQKKINVLQEEINMKEEIDEYKRNKEKIEKMMIQKEDKPNHDEIIYDIPTPKYREEAFFKNYKELKNQFYVDSTETLKKFIEEHKDDKKNKEYDKFKKIKDHFNKETVYECLTLNPEEQYEIVDKILNKDEKKLVKLEKHVKKEFSILEFLDEIEIRIKETDPTIYVYVPNKEINYDKLNERIKTILYKNMSEGIIIEYHNKMYDYSI